MSAPRRGAARGPRLGLAAGFAIAAGLPFAAAPTFAVMAALTAAADGGAAVLCGAPQASLIGGMATMYLLMAAFHAGPWLRLLRPGWVVD